MSNDRNRAAAPEETTLRTFLTAAEAFPALERAFLDAREEIWASFLVFDPDTRLRSPEALAVGRTWFDLIVDTLRRGVAIFIVISDFDPVARAALHRATWRSVRQFHAAAEIAGPAARLRVVPAMHASETGLLPRTFFYPVILAKLARTAGWLNRLPADRQAAALRDMPGVERRMRRRADGRWRPRLWPIPRLFPGTHHQKIAVIDRRLLYVGGLDLDERRYDTPHHDRPGDETWHDVQVMLTGPVVAEAQAHLQEFLSVVEAKAEPTRGRQFLRTLSRKRRFALPFFGPEQIRHEIMDAHLHLIGQAERLIYLETQYFRDRRLARALADAARANPDLGLILVLPGAPDDLAFAARVGMDVRIGEWKQAQCLRMVQRAFRDRLFVGGAAQRKAGEQSREHDRDRLAGAPIIYIHAKVSVFDDRAAIVSSANLNGRSLRWDTEAGVRLDDPALVRPLRDRVMAHWLPDGAGQEFFQPATAVTAWRALAWSNAESAPAARRGFILPYDFRAVRRDAVALPLLPDEMV